MTQKVLKVGTSAAVTIPKKSLEDLGIQIGDTVDVQVDQKRRSVVVKPKEGLADKELLDWARRFIDHYRPALKALAQK